MFKFQHTHTYIHTHIYLLILKESDVVFTFLTEEKSPSKLTHHRQSTVNLNTTSMAQSMRSSSSNDEVIYNEKNIVSTSCHRLIAIYIQTMKKLKKKATVPKILSVSI